ncbi:AAA family ATPase [Chloroflexota bacterium]
MKRIIIGGATCSGKTTLASNLAHRLGYPHVEMDALFWEADWQEAPPDIFRERVSQALDGATWITDGNYSSVRDLVWGRADTLVWLDYRLVVIMPRLFKRTLARIITQEKLWGKTQDSWRHQLGRGSIFLLLLKSHPRHRRTYSALLQDPVYAHLNAIQLRSPRATQHWLATIDAPNLNLDNLPHNAITP